MRFGMLIRFLRYFGIGDQKRPSCAELSQRLSAAKARKVAAKKPPKREPVHI